jgi:fructokinase
MHFIERAHLCKMSEEEALLISNCSTLEDACLFFQQKSNATICVTLGKNGTLVSIPNQPLFTVDTIRIEAIDTTGSGDAFIGCLLAEWAKTTSGSVIQINSGSSQL